LFLERGESACVKEKREKSGEKIGTVLSTEMGKKEEKATEGGGRTKKKGVSFEKT